MRKTELLGIVRRKPIDVTRFTPAQIARFWAKVDRRGPEECWLWLGGTTVSHGFEYGICTMAGELYKPHRIAFALETGAIDEALTIDHVRECGCTSKLCCNYRHMEQVTESENTLRQYRDPARLYALTCSSGHAVEFGCPTCRRCQVAAVARSMAKKPEKYRAMKREQKRNERARKRLES